MLTMFGLNVSKSKKKTYTTSKHIQKQEHIYFRHTYIYLKYVICTTVIIHVLKKLEITLKSLSHFIRPIGMVV
jgi:hypothetical protein